MELCHRECSEGTNEEDDFHAHIQFRTVMDEMG